MVRKKNKQYNNQTYKHYVQYLQLYAVNGLV